MTAQIRHPVRECVRGPGESDARRSVSARSGAGIAQAMTASAPEVVEYGPVDGFDRIVVRLRRERRIRHLAIRRLVLPDRGDAAGVPGGLDFGERRGSDDDAIAATYLHVSEGPTIIIEFVIQPEIIIGPVAAHIRRHDPIVPDGSVPAGCAGRVIEHTGRLLCPVMAEFVHITAARVARRIERSGIAARSHGWAGGRGVYCMPVLASFTLTYQWVRELRRWHPGVLVAVHLRLPDNEPVTVGRYGAPPSAVTAAQAVAAVRALDDPHGYEVFVPRAVAAAEIRRIRDVPQGVGWRYLPAAHGRRPCVCPACVTRGGYKVARLRRRFPYDEPPAPKSELMARLRTAATADEIIDVLGELGRGRRGGAEELAYLADHPDIHVRDSLESVLGVYRGREARRLRERLQAGDSSASDPGGR